MGVCRLHQGYAPGSACTHIGGLEVEALTRNAWSTQHEKIEFLKRNPELREVDGEEIVRRMKKAKLVSPTTYWLDLAPSWLKRQAYGELEEGKT